VPEDVNELHDQLKAAWAKAAKATYPLAVDAEVTGATEDEVNANAAASHERISQLVEQQSKAKIAEIENRLKKSAWGGGSGGPGNGSTAKPAWHAQVDQIWQRIRDGQLQRGDGEKLSELRFSDILRNSETTSPKLREWANSGKAGFGRN
jgi:hypothetical protein